MKKQIVIDMLADFLVGIDFAKQGQSDSPVVRAGKHYYKRMILILKTSGYDIKSEVEKKYRDML